MLALVGATIWRSPKEDWVVDRVVLIKQPKIAAVGTRAS